VLADARALLARPGNDFSWSRWDNEREALAEMDQLAADPSVQELRALFAPTGPIQEVSLSSGWGDDFLQLACRFDAAIEQGL
jgi:hypothetical protein